MKADVRAYIEKLQSRGGTGPSKPGAAAQKPAEHIDFAKWGPITKQPLSPLRQVIARRMSENWNTIPHVTQQDRADITELEQLRAKFSPRAEEAGVLKDQRDVIDVGHCGQGHDGPGLDVAE